MIKGLLCFVFLCISIAAVHAQFEEGYYFDKNGVKHTGLIKHKYGARTFSDGPDNSIVFKETKKSKKVDLTVDDVKAFVIQSDSFTILKSFSINDFAWYQADFVKVIEVGKINLYYHYTTVPNQYGGSSATTSLVQKKYGSPKALSKKEFNKNYADLFSGNDELISKIESKKLGFDNLRDIIKEYNASTSKK